MIPLLREPPRTLLCIGAHADDIEMGCGGTILRLLETFPGLAVRWVVLSGGEVRAAEAHSSAEQFLRDAGEKHVEIAEFQDSAFPYNDAIALKKFFRELSALNDPDLIFTHCRDDLHQDHRFVAELTWQHFRDHMILEYEIPKYEGDLGRPSVFVPLPTEAVKRKVDTLVSSFGSQHDKPWFSAETFHSLLHLRGIECRSPTGAAEAFHCAKMVLT